MEIKGETVKLRQTRQKTLRTVKQLSPGEVKKNKKTCKNISVQYYVYTLKIINYKEIFPKKMNCELLTPINEL